jgi:ABC-2 type transport system ATP-binding protein
MLSFEIKDLSVTYKNFHVSGVNFKLKSGDIMGLLGRSGSGKSTLIKSILGFKKHKRGTINLFIDEEVSNIKDSIGYSPQSNSLYPFLSLEENLKVFGRLHGVSKKILNNRINDLLKKLDLTYSRKKRITQLSGGMAKRADLATTLIHNPDVIILDEPFSGLDVSIRKLMWKIIGDLSKEGKIIIISSHLLTDIQKHCNKYGLIEEGHFYSTTQLIKAIQKTKEKSFELFLESIFSKSLSKE